MSSSFSPQQLARDFSAKSELTRHGVRTLYEAVCRSEPPALGQWSTLFGTACGRDPDGPSAAVARLAESYGLATAALKPRAILFALHTYYALLVKLLVGRFRELRGRDFFRDDLFSWCTDQPLVGELTAAVAEYDPDTLSQGRDLLGQLYQELFPARLRHELGEFYTPDWLARHVLDQVGYPGNPARRLLDPACGSGTFLVAAIERILAGCRAVADGVASYKADGVASRKDELCRKILANVVGFDLNPSAVLTARANYLIAIRELLPEAGQVDIPVYLCDSILDKPESTGSLNSQFDYIVGNPPWIAWDNLPVDYRRATKPLWERYGLFSLSGSEGRHGGGKKDLSMLMMYSTADRYLKLRGRLGMVVTQTLFQTKGAGDGFRRFRLGPDGDWLNVLRVDDMVAIRPFPDAANWTSTIVLEKGNRTQYPVPYVKWSAGDHGNFTQRTYRAEPIEPARPGSPWFLRPEGLEAELERLVGPSDYQARLGANTGGANGVYWVEVLARTDGGVLVRNLAGRGARGIDVIEQVIEPGLLYPLVRWSDVARFHAAPSAHILLAQDVRTRTGIDESVMRRDYPKTYDYLKQFDRVLKARAAYKRYQESKAFYSMYNVGPYTVAPIKVVWRRMDRRINAAMIGQFDDPVLGTRPVIPQETCVLIAAGSTAEAHYVCAVLNSSIVNFLVTSHSVCGGKGFGTPGMLDFVKLRRFDPDDPRHEELAACSRQAHRAVAAGAPFQRIQHHIDQLAAELWGLEETELAVISAK